MKKKNVAYFVLNKHMFQPAFFWAFQKYSF